MGDENIEDFSYVGQHTYDNMVLPGIMSALNIDRAKKFRFEGDVLVSSYPRTGSTWVRELIWLIMNNGDTEAATRTSLFTRTPYLEQMYDPKGTITMDIIHTLPRPQIIKTHLPARMFAEQLPRDDVRILVPIRNPKDVLVSYYNFHRAEVLCNFFKGSWDDFFQLFKADKLAYGNVCEFYRGWLDLKDDPKVMLVKYEDMKADLPGEIKRIASFLGETLPDNVMKKIASHGDFNSMKNNTMTNCGTLSPATYDQNITPFLRSAKVGDWKNYFSKEQSDFVDELYAREFSSRGFALEFE